jgi:rod shape-determining protein MreC
MFYTSGEDRVFPKGLPVGKVTSVSAGADFQNILVRPSGIESAPEEVLVIVDPVHQAIPEAPAADTPVYLAPPVSGQKADTAAVPEHATPADKLMEQYKKIGDAQKHTFGAGGPGTPAPNFNLKVPGVNAPAEAGQTAGGQSAAPQSAGKPPAGSGNSEARPASNPEAPRQVNATAPNSAGARPAETRTSAPPVVPAQPPRVTQPKAPATDSGPQF